MTERFGRVNRMATSRERRVDIQAEVKRSMSAGGDRVASGWRE